jgi:hypothetical protein
MKRFALPLLLAITPLAAPSTALAQAPAMAALAPLVSGQRVRVKKLARDMANVRASIKTTGPSEFQNGTIVAKYKKRFTQFNEAVARYPQLSDPDVIAARNEYNLLAEALTTEFARAKAQLETLGDVQVRLRTIEENSRKYAAPAPLSLPFSQAQANAWVKASSEARTVAEHNKQQLAIIEPIAYLPKNRGVVQSGALYDIDDVKRLGRMADGMFAGVQANAQVLLDGLGGQLRQIDQTLKTRWIDAPDEEHRWLYISETSEADAAKVYDEAMAMANSALFLNKALGRPLEKAEAMIARIEQAKTSFAQKQQAALESSKLPKPKSKNKKQLKFARQIIETPKYEFGPAGRIVITTDKIVERTRKSSEIEIDDVEFKLGGDIELSGTETTWTYTWKEFRFAVPLQDAGSGKWYIWWITAKKFSSGGDRTPIGRWVSGKATKGNQILAKNIGK